MKERFMKRLTSALLYVNCAAVVFVTGAAPFAGGPPFAM
jgi:hypothetical protein